MRAPAFRFEPLRNCVRRWANVKICSGVTNREGFFVSLRLLLHAEAGIGTGWI